MVKRRKNKGKSAEQARRRRAPTKKSGPSVSVILQETVPLFPVSTMRYEQLYYDYRLSLTLTSGVIQKYVFSANGAYDPDITGTGHQPAGFDQMMLFYEQAVVVKSKIKLSFTSGSATYVRGAVGLYPDTTTPTISETIENGLVVTDVVSGATGESGFHKYKTLELTCDVPKYFGRARKELITSPEFYCTAASNPTEQVYFMCLFWNQIEAVTAVLVFDVILSFDIYYYEPRKIANSLSSQEMKRKEKR